MGVEVDAWVPCWFDGQPWPPARPCCCQFCDVVRRFDDDQAEPLEDGC